MWCQNCRVNIEVQTLLPREKSRPLVKGWGVGCLKTTTILRCTIASCMPWCSLPWKRNEFPRQACAASVPHHKTHENENRPPLCGSLSQYFSLPIPTPQIMCPGTHFRVPKKKDQTMYRINLLIHPPTNLDLHSLRVGWRNMCELP